MADKHRSLDELSEDEIKAMHDLVVETSPTPEEETEEARTKREERKRKERDEKETLLFETANTWAAVHTPE